MRRTAFGVGVGRRRQMLARGARLDRAEVKHQKDETGAVLILALVYIIVIGLTVTALASWATNDLNNTTHFNSTSEFHYAVSSATDTAIQSVRYAPLPTSTPPQKVNTPVQQCFTPVAPIDGYNVAVWCSTYEDNSQGTTRVVNLYACLTTVSSTDCQATPTLAAQVTFDDYPSGGGVLLVEQCNLQTGVCGYGQTLNSWVWG